MSNAEQLEERHIRDRRRGTWVTPPCTTTGTAARRTAEPSGIGLRATGSTAAVRHRARAAGATTEPRTPEWAGNGRRPSAESRTTARRARCRRRVELGQHVVEDEDPSRPVADVESAQRPGLRERTDRVTGAGADLVVVRADCQRYARVLRSECVWPTDDFVADGWIVSTAARICGEFIGDISTVRHHHHQRSCATTTWRSLDQTDAPASGSSPGRHGGSLATSAGSNTRSPGGQVLV